MKKGRRLVIDSSSSDSDSDSDLDSKFINLTKRKKSVKQRNVGAYSASSSSSESAIAHVGRSKPCTMKKEFPCDGTATKNAGYSKSGMKKKDTSSDDDMDSNVGRSKLYMKKKGMSSKSGMKKKENSNDESINMHVERRKSDIKKKGKTSQKRLENVKTGKENLQHTSEYKNVTSSGSANKKYECLLTDSKSDDSEEYKNASWRGMKSSKIAKSNKSNYTPASSSENSSSKSFFGSQNSAVYENYNLESSEFIEEEYSDGYGSDMMGDEEDRARLASMTEVEREKEIFRRIEERDSNKIRFQIEQKLKRAQWEKRKAEVENKKQRKSTQKESASRGMSIASQTSPLALSSGISSSSAIRFHRPPNTLYTKDPWNFSITLEHKRKDLEEMISVRHVNKKLKLGISDAGEKLCFSTKMKMHSRDNGDDGQTSNFNEELLNSRIKSINETLFGSYVRILTKRGNNAQDRYKIGEIINIREVDVPYQCEKNSEETKICLNVRHADEIRTIKLIFVSNRPFTESEFSSWLNKCQQKQVQIPTIAKCRFKMLQFEALLFVGMNKEQIENMLNKQLESMKQEKSEIKAKVDAKNNHETEDGVRFCQKILMMEAMISHCERKFSSTVSCISDYIQTRNIGDASEEGNSSDSSESSKPGWNINKILNEKKTKPAVHERPKNSVVAASKINKGVQQRNPELLSKQNYATQQVRDTGIAKGENKEIHSTKGSPERKPGGRFTELRLCIRKIALQKKDDSDSDEKNLDVAQPPEERRDTGKFVELRSCVKKLASQKKDDDDDEETVNVTQPPAKSSGKRRSTGKVVELRSCIRKLASQKKGDTDDEFSDVTLSPSSSFEDDDVSSEDDNNERYYDVNEQILGARSYESDDESDDEAGNESDSERINKVENDEDESDGDISYEAVGGAVKDDDDGLKESDTCDEDGRTGRYVELRRCIRKIALQKKRHK